MRRLVHSGRAHVPSLPEFVRLCRTVGNDEEFGGDPPKALPAPDEFQGDGWDLSANRHLLGHLVRSIAIDRRKYTREEVGRLVDAKKAWAADMRDLSRNGEVPIEMQRTVWTDYIGRAQA
jgi:hypothetical protein